MKAEEVDRHLYMGASDAGAVLGVSKWKTPHQLFLEKTGQAQPEPQNFHMELGDLMEPVVLTLFERNKGWPTCRKVQLFHPELPWLRVNLDATAETGDGEVVVVEAKTASVKKIDGWGPNGSDQIPAAYWAQVQVQLHVAHLLNDGVKRAFVPTFFFSGKSFQVFEVAYDPALAESVVAKMEIFWNRVQAKSWPQLEAA